MTIGEKIKLARKLRNLTQRELGLLVDLADDRIRQYEANIRTPKESQLIKFSHALGVPVEFLSDFNVDTPTKLIHFLFELEYQNAIEIRPIYDDSHSTVNYGIVFKDSLINSFIETWFKMTVQVKESLNGLEESERLQLDFGTHPSELRGTINNDYLKWKSTYSL